MMGENARKVDKEVYQLSCVCVCVCMCVCVCVHLTYPINLGFESFLTSQHHKVF